jgi:hypothetical protein
MLVLAMKFSSRTTGGEAALVVRNKQAVSAEGAGVAFPCKRSAPKALALQFP